MSDTGEVDIKRDRLVITASSLGTVFEWYDFFIYGTLAAIIGKAFFPSDNATLEILLVWAGFAVGFGFRPLGAVLFGFLGDVVVDHRNAGPRDARGDPGDVVGAIEGVKALTDNVKRGPGPDAPRPPSGGGNPSPFATRG